MLVAMELPGGFEQAFLDSQPHCPELFGHYFLQRVAASQLASGLQYFGVSIHGQLDLNEDGLVDLAVGALGNAVILWLVPYFS